MNLSRDEMAAHVLEHHGRDMVYWFDSDIVELIGEIMREPVKHLRVARWLTAFGALQGHFVKRFVEKIFIPLLETDPDQGILGACLICEEREQRAMGTLVSEKIGGTI